MSNCVFARSRNAHRLYVWQNGVFLFWMDAKKRWARSDLVQHLYDEAYCKNPDVTPEEWFVDSSDFTILDEYEVPADALATLQEVTLCKNVPTADAAATMDAPAAGAKAATSTTPAAVKSCHKTPISPAVVSAASGPSHAATAYSAEKFDYSGLDAQTQETLKGAGQMFRHGKSMAEIGMRHMADAVGLVHDELVAPCDNSKFGNRGEDSFRQFCKCELRISKDTAYRLLQVSNLYSNSTPEQQKALDSLSPSLLYAAAKPSAPPALVQAVKDGDITTHKQYQELLKENQQLRADRVNALNAAQAAERARDAALADVNGLHTENKKLRSECAEAVKQRDGARHVAEAANLRADKWQREAEASKAAPVPSTAVDEDELNRRAEALAAELTAPLREELDALKAHPPAAAPDAKADARHAYDSLLLIGRSMKNAWASVKPQLAKLQEDARAAAITQLNSTLTEIQTEAMKCL